jgi:hypothetical protein
MAWRSTWFLSNNITCHNHRHNFILFLHNENTHTKNQIIIFSDYFIIIIYLAPRNDSSLLCLFVWKEREREKEGEKKNNNKIDDERTNEFVYYIIMDTRWIMRSFFFCFVVPYHSTLNNVRMVARAANGRWIGE